MTDSSKPRRSKRHAGARAAACREPPTPDPIDAANLEEAFVKALEADFILHGKAAIAALRAEKPTDYMKIVAALHAKGASDATDPFREMSDAELDRRIEELARHAGFEIRVADAPAGGRATADDGADAD